MQIVRLCARRRRPDQRRQADHADRAGLFGSVVPQAPRRVSLGAGQTLRRQSGGGVSRHRLVRHLGRVAHLQRGAGGSAKADRRSVPGSVQEDAAGVHVRRCRGAQVCAGQRHGISARRRRLAVARAELDRLEEIRRCAADGRDLEAIADCVRVVRRLRLPPVPKVVLRCGRQLHAQQPCHADQRQCRQGPAGGDGPIGKAGAPGRGSAGPSRTVARKKRQARRAA